MSSTNFDYEFIFHNGVFEQTIYNQCTIPDTLGNRQAAIEGLVSTIQGYCN